MKLLSRQNKDLRILVWSIVNAGIAFGATLLVKPELAPYSPILVPILNLVTKYINTKYFGDLGVTTVK
jgi:hypothetical protein